MSRVGRILLVDDDRDDVDVALRAIRREGLAVQVSVANDGRDALVALGIEPAVDGAAPGPLPQVVFLDLKMPRIDGWEVLRRMRANERTRGIPVIIVSWSDQKQDVRRCYELGANSFLVKRFTPMSPGAAFAQAVRYWTELNQPPPGATA